MNAPLLACPSCSEPVAAGDAFCEGCGTALTAAADTAGPPSRAVRACSSCGGEVGDDGYCTVCGVRAGNGREHVVATPSATVAGVCDRGIVHPRNEDAMALAVAPGWSALVVCDGVTSSTDSDVASQAAADVARDVLAAAPGPASASPAARVAYWSDQLRAAGRAAGVAAAHAGPGDTANPPSCTFVAAVSDGDLIMAAWIGDSRAYWLPDEGAAEQLSVDDSWATEQIAAGVPREVAETGPHAHAITRWLGRDSPPGDASTSTTTVRSPGWLLVCSDGLWNYCSEAADLTALVADQVAALVADVVADVAAAPQAPEPLALAEALVAWANGQGGHDNITATLARLVPAPLDSIATTAEGAS